MISRSEPIFIFTSSRPCAHSDYAAFALSMMQRLRLRLYKNGSLGPVLARLDTSHTAYMSGVADGDAFAIELHN